MSLAFLVSEADAEKIGTASLSQISKAVDIFGQIELSLVSLEEIQEINHEQREINEPTDVLSFPIYPSLAEIPKSEMVPLLGSVLICPEQAEHYGETLPQLVVHGILHIFGYDHEIDREVWLFHENYLLQELAKQGLVVRGIEQW